MSRTIDERIVEMRFDNSQFERNVQTSMSTLEKLKQKLNLKGASRGLEELDSAAKKVNMRGLGDGIEVVKAKFSALQVVGMTALANITNSAVNAGKKLVSALTIDPVKDGFAEYETQMNAVQTILANTQKEGTNVATVNKALDELNTYADKTIYNFTEMTRNIGTFTAAGVKLDTSVSAIKGIANLAAVSGSTSQQASTAMYQLSQALAAGKVQLMDWNSVVNAGMGGQVFQDALIRTSEHLKTGAKEAIAANGSFRESLTKTGWLTTEVLTQTLDQFATAADTQEEYEAAVKKFVGQGYSQEEAKQMADMARTAGDAATKVKTFTQLIDTLKEALGSGWTTSWRTIIGDFEEAKSLWTSVSDTLGDYINKSSDARNKMLQEWADMGGRTAGIEAVKNAFKGLVSIVTPIKKAFRDIFPPMTAQQLFKITEGVRDLTAKFILSDSTAEKLGKTFKGIFSVADVGLSAVKALGKGFFSIIGNLTGFTGGILDVTAAIGDGLTAFRNYVKETDIFGNTIGKATDFINKAISKFKEFGSSLKEGFSSAGYEGFFGFLKGIWDMTKQVGSGIADALTSVIQTITKMFNGSNIFEVFNNGILTGILFYIGKFVKSITSITDGGADALENLTGILDDVRGCFQAYQDQLKAGTLMKIAAAIGVLAAALFVISTIDGDALARALAGITVLFAELIGSLALFGKIDMMTKGVVKAISLMIGLSTAIVILAGAMKILGSIEWEGIAKGLLSIGALMAGLSVFLRTFKFDGKLTSVALGIVILSSAMIVLSKAVANFAGMDWMELAKGLSSIGILLTELALFTRVAGNAKHMISIGAGLLLIGQSMKAFASAMADFGKMEWSEIVRGLVAMAGALAEVAIAMNFMPKNMIVTGAGLVIVSEALKRMATALSSFGNMSWSEIARGLTSMGAALAEIAIAMNLMPKGTILVATGLIVAAQALKVMAEALSEFSGMSWSEIGRGLTSMGVALGELAIALNLMNGTIAGSAALLIAASALTVLAPVMESMGGMSWSEIAKGLITMAGAFAVIGIAGMLLTPIIPSILGLSAALALLGVAAIGIGAGVTMIATGIASLATALSVGATVIVAGISAIVVGIAELVPTLARILAEAIVEITKVIGECAPQLVKAIMTLLMEVVDSLVTYTPQIINALLDMIIDIINGLADHMPEIIQAFMNLVGSIFEGIVNSLDNIDATNLLKGILAVKLMTMVMQALSSVVALIPTAMAGVLGISLVVAEIGLVLAAFGGLAQIPGLSWLIEEGGYFLQKIGTAIGQLIGGLIGGVAKGATNALPEIAADLSNFMMNITPFIEGAKKIDSSMLEGVNTLAKTILLLSAADLVSGIASFVNGGKSLGDFAKQLVPFGEALKSYGETVNGINSEAISASVKAAKSLMEVAKAIPAEGGIWQMLAGEKDLGSFGNKLIPFAKGMKSYSQAVEGIKAESITASATAAKAIVNVANSIPAEGGFWQLLAGEKNLGSFGEKLIPFGKGMRLYSQAVAGLNVNSIAASAEATKAIVAVANAIPSEGGLWQLLAGGKDLGSFGTKLAPFGKGLKAYANSVEGLDASSITASATAAKGIVEVANAIPSEGGFWSLINGEKNLGGFGTSLVPFGTGMRAYAHSVEGLDASSIISSATAAKAIVEVANSIPSEGGFWNLIDGKKDLASFGNKLIPFGYSMKAYADAVTGIDTVSISLSALAAQSLIEVANSIPTEGGFWSLIDGKKDLGSFGEKLVPFANGMKAYADAVAGIDTVSITLSANAAQALVSVANSIPAEGGFWSLIDGEKNLASFGDKLVPFANGMRAYAEAAVGIDTASIMASIPAAQALISVANSIPPEGGFWSLVEGEKNLASFGTKLVPFGLGMQAYSQAVAGLDTASILTSVTAAQALVSVANSIPPEGGFWSLVEGEKNLGSFGDKLVPFANGMRAYAQASVGIDTESILASANAAKAIVNVANSIPAEGGFWSIIDGDKDLASFGAKLVPFGSGMRAYGQAVVGIDIESITASASAAKALIGVANSLSNSGSILEFFTGKKDLGVIGEQLVPFGIGMKKYAICVAGVDIEAITASLPAARGMIKVASSIFNSGGVLEYFTGKKDLGSIGSQLVPFAKSMRNYAIAIAGVDVEAITASVPAAKGLIKVANAVANSGGALEYFTGKKDLSSLSSQLVPFGKAMKSYSVAIAGIDAGAISSSATAAKKLVSLLNSMNGISTTGANSFKNAIDTLAKTNIKGVIKAFEGSSSKLSSIGSNIVKNLAKGLESKSSSLTSAANRLISTTARTMSSKTSLFSSAGKSLMGAFVNGISSQSGAASSAAASCVSAALSGLNGRYSDFYNAGAHVASGFANGISQGTYAAAAKARAMAQAAYNAAKSALDINSPSKLFRRLGYCIPEGFAQGIDRMSKYVENSSLAMANVAIDGTQDAITHISDIINGDIDIQPTIRPVVDLNGVKTGVNAINGILDNKTTLGLEANLSSINTMMNRRNQNGVNDDIISAIDKLRNDIGNINNNSYTINGVTYDDGSNIEEAVKAIVRAARIERRI